MSKPTSRAGTAPFAHLLGRVLGKKPDGKRADEGDLEPDDDAVVDQGEVDDALDDAEVDDLEDGEEPPKEAEDDEADDEAHAEEPEDDKEAKAYRRGVAAGRKAENARCKAIFSADAAGARPDIAAQLAFGTRQSSAEAVGVLDAVASGGATPRGLGARMSERAEPRPGGGDDKPAGGGSFVERLAAAKKKAGKA